MVEVPQTKSESIKEVEDVARTTGANKLIKEPRSLVCGAFRKLG